MSYKNKSSSNKANSRTFFWTSKKTHQKKKNSFNYPKKKEYTEELDNSPQKENLPENIQKNEVEPKFEEEYQGLVYHPQYTEIIPAGIIYFIETEKKEDYNNFKTKWKTEICRYWEMYGECKFGENCAFAHGDSELKQRKLTFNYKTKPCKQFFELGYCSYGIRCQFSHKKDDFLRDKNEINGICGDNNKISYLKIIKEFLSDDNNNISLELVRRPRLKTFENITRCSLKESENSKLKLYEDIINIKNNIINNKNNDKKIKMKYSEDSYYTNFSSDNNENNNDNNDKDSI